MSRLQLIEIHEQAWFPTPIRDLTTGALQFGFNFLHAYAPVVPLLKNALQATGSLSIVDLCSGGGGPWLQLSRKLREEVPGVQIQLTDKYPNSSALASAGRTSQDSITCYPRAVDATAVPGELRGFRTMFTSFHHFPPAAARAILQNAVDAGEGVGIFEITRRAPSAIGMVLAWDLLLIVGTFWIRPFRWSRLLWTFLLPVIPFVLVFDGIVSCLRTYQPREMEEIVSQLTAPGYCWQSGELSSGKAPITYLVGYPRRLGSEPCHL